MKLSERNHSRKIFYLCLLASLIIQAQINYWEVDRIDRTIDYAILLGMIFHMEFELFKEHKPVNLYLTFTLKVLTSLIIWSILHSAIGVVGEFLIAKLIWRGSLRSN